MLCPHCTQVFDDQREHGLADLTVADNARAVVHFWRCPGCKHLVIDYQRSRHQINAPENLSLYVGQVRIYPRGSGRRRCPPEVARFDADLSRDYNEACDILPLSAQASAALGRRCLQHILRFHLGITGEPNLAAEIQAATGMLTPPLLRQLTAVRHIGNNGAHPTTDHAGEIMPVTEDDAIWTLDTIEKVLIFLFVEPVAEYDRTVALNVTLSAARKKLMDLPPLPKERPAGSADEKPDDAE